jgi:hypothetical protein
MYDKEVVKMMKEWLAKLALVVFIVSMIFVAVNTMPQHKSYHCHGKNFHLYESIEANGNVFLKTKKECIDIRDIPFRTSIKGVKK